MRVVEALPAVFLIIVSSVVLLGTADLNYWDDITPGPRFFPIWLAGISIALSLALLFQLFRGTDTGETELPSRAAAVRVAATVAAMVVFNIGTLIILPALLGLTLVSPQGLIMTLMAFICISGLLMSIALSERQRSITESRFSISRDLAASNAEINAKADYNDAIVGKLTALLDSFKATQTW